MTRALFKKQMMEVFAWIYRDKKSGKNRSWKGIALYVGLYLVIFGFLGVMFFMVADMLCEPLAAAGYGWLFFALMGLISVALGVFGSVFNTYASLYRAKDNDLLLSMPIPPRVILMTRLSGVYAMGLMYELIVMIPTLIVYYLNVRLNALGVAFSLLTPLVLSVLVLTLSCVLGWVVALISERLKHKSLITVVLSLAFLTAYYYFYMQAYSMLQAILFNPAQLGDAIRGALFPFYHMGLAADGNALSMLIFTGTMAALFAAVYLVLSRSFVRLATTNRGAAKAKYTEKALKAGSVNGALLRKELRHFLGSATYMLNCGLGLVLMPAAAVALLIKGDAVVEFMAMFDESAQLLPLLTAAAICMLTTMNDITAPSVSLEGKSLWLAQSLPVTPWQVLRAKVRLHLLLGLPSTLILVVCACAALKLTLIYGVLIAVVAVLFVLLTALAGLALNLKMPNLKWTDETVPVKQSMSVMLTLFGGWAVVVALGGAYAALSRLIGPKGYLVCVAVLLAAVCAALTAWIRTRGARIFSSL